MKYQRGDQLLHNGRYVEIVDRDPHFKGYLVITLEDKGKVGGICNITVPETEEKIELRTSSNPFATKKEVSEHAAIPDNFEHYQDMMNHTFWVNQKDLIKITQYPNLFQRMIMRLFL